MPAKTAHSFVDLPHTPALYAMYTTGGRRTCQYVGISQRGMRGRLEQHFLRRDSSVVTGAAAVTLNPDKIDEVWWWEREEYSDGMQLRAAELLAAQELRPVLSSRTGHGLEVTSLADEAMRTHVSGYLPDPTGVFYPPTNRTLQRRVDALEDEVHRLRALLD